MFHILLISLLSLSIVGVDLTSAQEVVRNTFTEAALLDELSKVNDSLTDYAEGLVTEKKVSLDLFKLSWQVNWSTLKGNASEAAKELLEQIQQKLTAMSLEKSSSSLKNGAIMALCGLGAAGVAYLLSKRSEKVQKKETIDDTFNKYVLIGGTGILGALAGYGLFVKRTTDLNFVQFSFDYLKAVINGGGTVSLRF